MFRTVRILRTFPRQRLVVIPATRRFLALQTQPKQPTKDETPVEEALREAKEKLVSDHLKEVPTDLSQEPNIAEKKSLWQRVKAEAVHYWHGTRLLGVEISISARLLSKLLGGAKLSRREIKQLRRTTGDLLRLIPMVIILIIPFLELALPVLLRLFPSMLPSTFESKFQEEENRKKLLKLRLEMAKFLQETVGEVALSGTSKSADAKEFTDFFQKCRTVGEPAPTEDIIRVARKFKDEITLSNLSRPQLVSMAKYMSLNAIGTDSFLRYLIENKLVEIRHDDVVIEAEGVDSLDISELINACLARGIRTVGVSPARMRQELSQWLDLHLKNKIPSTLLVLSHAFQTTDRFTKGEDEALKTKAEALQAALSSLPHQVINEAQLKISENEGSATYKQKLDVLKEQEEMIADELEEDSMHAAAKKLKIDDSKKKQDDDKLKNASKKAEEDKLPPVVTEYPSLDEITVVPQQIVEIIGAKSTLNPEIASQMMKEIEMQAEDMEGRLSDEELKNLTEVLKTVTKDSAVEDIRDFLSELKENRKEFKEKDIEELKQFTQAEPGKGSSRLGSRVDKMISSIEKELSNYDQEVGTKLNLVKTNDEGQISISDLEEALKVIRDRPNDERIKKIVNQLDGDHDGLVAMNEILMLVQDKEGHGEIIEVLKEVINEKESKKQ